MQTLHVIVAHSVCQSRTVKLNLPREMFCSLVEQWRRTIADDGVAWRHPRLSPAVARSSTFRTRRCPQRFEPDGIHDYPCMLTSITISRTHDMHRSISQPLLLRSYVLCLCVQGQGTAWSRALSCAGRFVVGLDISECAFVHRPPVLCFYIHQIVFGTHDMLVRTKFALFRSSDSSALSSRQ